MMSNSAGAMGNDDHLRDRVRNVCNGEVVMLATTGLAGLLYSVHEGSIAGVFFFLPMIVAALVCAEKVYNKTYRDNAAVGENIKPILSDQTIAEIPIEELSE